MVMDRRGQRQAMRESMMHGRVRTASVVMHVTLYACLSVRLRIVFQATLGTKVFLISS